MRVIETNTMIDQDKVCDKSGKCHSRINIYESHTVNGSQVVFYTPGEKDVDQILELDRMYLDSDIDRKSVLRNVIINEGFIIGIKVDGKLQGYCHHKPLPNMDVRIVWFCANKGYGTPLYTFMQKYLKLNDFTRIILIVSLEGSYAVRRINFWYHMGFTTYETNPRGAQIYMEKFI